MDQIIQDQKLIEALGGPSKVAQLLGFPKLGGQQRVQNWLIRGIPSAVKVQRPDLFMPERAAAQTGQAQAATENVAGHED
jgi:hypothetical protein